jgi:hypothetical protein
MDAFRVTYQFPIAKKQPRLMREITNHIVFGNKRQQPISDFFKNIQMIFIGPE